MTVNALPQTQSAPARSAEAGAGPRARAEVALTLAETYVRVSRTEAALSAGKRARALLLTAQQLLTLNNLQGSAHDFLAEQGGAGSGLAREESLRCHGLALSAAEQIGSPFGAQMSCINLAIAHARRGDLAEAQARFEATDAGGDCLRLSLPRVAQAAVAPQPGAPA